MPVEIDIRENAFYKWGVEEATPKAEARGEAKLLTKFLERRFGPLPDSLRSRLAAADVQTLDRWADRMDSATTLDEVFAD